MPKPADLQPSPTGLFLVTCVVDEGVYDNDFRVVRAPSRLAVAEDIVRDPWRWDDLLRGALFWDDVMGKYEYKGEEPPTPEELLEWMDSSTVDGDSYPRVSLYAILTIDNVGEQVEPRHDAQPNQSTDGH